MIPDLNERIREKCKASLLFTAKLLGYNEVNLPTHHKMIRALESDSPRKLIVMPRGTFKSSLGIVAYSIWRLIKNPNERILIDSELYTNSKNFLREIKGHLEQEHLVEIFGQFKSESNWSEGEITIKQRTEVLKEASLTAGGIGTGKTSQHFDVILCDDLNSNNNSLTQEGRQKVIDHYRMNIGLLEPGGTIVVIGTRYAADDVIGFIQENEINSK